MANHDTTAPAAPPPRREEQILIRITGRDRPGLTASAMGIAFHAKPRVVANARQSINTMGLDGVLYFLGFKDSYINV